MDFTQIIQLSGDALYNKALTFKQGQDDNSLTNYYIHLVMACNYGNELAKEEFYDDYYERLSITNNIATLQDYTERIKFFELTKEYPYSAFLLGEMYEQGRGQYLQQDYKKAKELYEYVISKDLKCTYASWRLALMYDLGKGVDQNPKLAKKYYKLSMDNKSPYEVYRCACNAYSNGNTGLQSAIKQFEEAVAMGYEKAVDKLVEIYKSVRHLKERKKKYVIDYFIGINRPEKLKDIYGYDDFAVYVMKQNGQLKKEAADLDLGLMMKSLMTVPINVVTVPVNTVATN